MRRARIEVTHKADSPRNLVRYARKIFNEVEYEAVWCVVDVDHFDVEAAMTLAQADAVELAVSEPCFELWLLLHFVDHKAYIANGKAACALLAKHVPGYDKKLDFSRFDAGVEAAIKRAKDWRRATRLLACGVSSRCCCSTEFKVRDLGRLR